MSLSDFLKKVEWLKSNHSYGGACIRINSEKIIYIDPANLSEENMKIKADIVLLTHSHDDHFSVKTLENIVKPTTIIVCPQDCEESLLNEHFEFNVYVIEPDETLKLNRVKIEAIPAYSSCAHPVSAGWVGYLIEINGFRIYHSGDSGFISEMMALKNIDIAFVTVREPYMMSFKEVIKAIEAFGPRILIPIHWIEEEKENIELIKKNSPKSTEVIMLEMT